MTRTWSPQPTLPRQRTRPCCAGGTWQLPNAGCNNWGRANDAPKLNMDRALEAFYHLLAAGAGDRVQEVAVELLSGKLDWALKKIQRFYEHLYQTKAPVPEQAKALEYWLALDPQEHKAWRFLGECHTKMAGWGSAKALHCFEQACKLLPSYPKYWANLGRAMREHGPDSARRLFVAVGASGTGLPASH